MDKEVVQTLLFLLNIFFGIAMWLLKNAYQDVKEQAKENRISIEHLRESAFKKEDFRDFKEELWKRMDKIEHDFLQRFRELRNV